MLNILRKLFPEDPNDPPEARRAVRALAQELERTQYGRDKIIESIANIHCRSATELLIAALDDKDTWVRKRAIEGLARSGAQSAVQPLLNRLSTDTEEITRHSIIDALGTLKATSAVTTLKAFLQDSKQRSIAFAAIDAIASIEGTSAYPLLESLLSSEDVTFRMHAARCITSLGVMPQSTAVRVLVAIGTEDFNAIAPLGPEAISALETIASRDSAYVQVHACQIIEQHGTPSSVPFLLKMMHVRDKQWAVSGCAKSALEKLAPLNQPPIISAITHGIGTESPEDFLFLCMLLHSPDLDSSLVQAVVDRVLKETYYASSAESALRKLLTNHAGGVSTSQLARIQELKDVTGAKGWDSFVGDTTISFETVRQLALKESRRRNDNQ